MSTSLRLKAKASTDVWRKPPATDISNAPKQMQKLPSRDFRSARVTISASWARLYDQGGLLILLPGSAEGKRYWIKAGVEFAGGRPNLSVVSAREWADWSLHPVVAPAAAAGPTPSLTIQIEREPIDIERGKGSSLLVYAMKHGERENLSLRKITWAFEQEGEVEIGVYAARPTKLDVVDEDELTVDFYDFKIELSR